MFLTDPCRAGDHVRCTAPGCDCGCGHPPTLKPIEVEVLCLWARRLTLRQVAAEMSYSVDNIKSHLKNARRRWGVATTNELMDAAILAGWPIR